MEKKKNCYLLNFPSGPEQFTALKIGDKVEINGEIYVARDTAHKRMIETLHQGKPLPFPLKNALIFYMGPSPSPPGMVIGSCGPTTSSRMDTMTVELLANGLRATMGKGRRAAAVAQACRKYQAIYLVTYGGCGAFLHRFVTECVLIAYPDLGPEAVYRLKVRRFPAVVAIDSAGRDFYEEKEKEYNGKGAHSSTG